MKLLSNDQNWYEDNDDGLVPICTYTAEEVCAIIAQHFFKTMEDLWNIQNFEVRVDVDSLGAGGSGQANVFLRRKKN